MTFGVSTIGASIMVTGLLYAVSKGVSPVSDPWLLGTQVAGVFGLLALSWTYILAMRHPFLERIFGGMDVVYKIHRMFGATAFILLLHHVVFLILRQLPANTLSLYLLPTTTVPYAFGIIGFYILFLLLVLTIYVDLPYRVWKQTHEWMGLVILFGAVHGLTVESDMSRFLPLKIWLITWSVFALAAFIYKRFIYYHVSARTFVIVDTQWEKDYIVLTVKAADPKASVACMPGQFFFISMDMPGKSHDEHPFSVMSHDADTVRFGIKVNGDFTLALARMPIGTRVILRGPFGSFGNALHHGPQMVWIAGGIGITPFVSFLPHVSPGQHVTLIHSVRGEVPSPVHRMIVEITRMLPNIRYIIHDTQTAGRLTSEKILSYVSLRDLPRVWLCGPQIMMQTLSEQLHARGILRKRIYFEDFSLR